MSVSRLETTQSLGPGATIENETVRHADAATSILKAIHDQINAVEVLCLLLNNLDNYLLSQNHFLIVLFP